MAPPDRPWQTLPGRLLFLVGAAVIAAIPAFVHTALVSGHNKRLCMEIYVRMQGVDDFAARQLCDRDLVGSWGNQTSVVWLLWFVVVVYVMAKLNSAR